MRQVKRKLLCVVLPTLGTNCHFLRRPLASFAQRRDQWKVKSRVQ